MSDRNVFTFLQAALAEDSGVQEDYVIIPPDPRVVSDEEDMFMRNIMPAEIAGRIEVFRRDEDNEADDVLAETEKSGFKPRWRKHSDILNVIPPDDHAPKPIFQTHPILSQKNEFEIFLTFFDTNIQNIILEESHRYAQKNNEHDFQFGQGDLYQFLGIFYLMGYHQLPREEYYWSKDSDIAVPLVPAQMSRTRFRAIKRNLHFANNNDLPAGDKMGKIRPLITAVNDSLQQFGCFCKHLSVDEQMIPYHGHHSCKQYVRGKPIRFGFKGWVCSCEHGFPFCIELYQVKGTWLAADVSDAKSVGMSGNVVLSCLRRVVTDPTCHIIFFDSFFASHALLCSLQDLGYRATGTIRGNRMANAPLKSLTEMSSAERGSVDYCSDGSIVACRWKDNAIVTMATNFDSVLPLNTVSCHYSVDSYLFRTLLIVSTFFACRSNDGQKSRGKWR
jgi:hypothetical protein